MSKNFQRQMNQHQQAAHHRASAQAQQAAQNAQRQFTEARNRAEDARGIQPAGPLPKHDLPIKVVLAIVGFGILALIMIYAG